MEKLDPKQIVAAARMKFREDKIDEITRIEKVFQEHIYEQLVKNPNADSVRFLLWWNPNADVLNTVIENLRGRGYRIELIKRPWYREGAFTVIVSGWEEKTESPDEGPYRRRVQ